MRKITLFLLLAFLMPNTWQEINSPIPTPMNFDVISSESPYDVGHIIPKSKGGSNTLENTQLEFASPNRSKCAN